MPLYTSFTQLPSETFRCWASKHQDLIQWADNQIAGVATEDQLRSQMDIWWNNWGMAAQQRSLETWLASEGCKIQEQPVTTVAPADGNLLFGLNRWLVYGVGGVLVYMFLFRRR